jgi:hypothetical protein
MSWKHAIRVNRAIAPASAIRAHLLAGSWVRIVAIRSVSVVNSLACRRQIIAFPQWRNEILVEVVALGRSAVLQRVWIASSLCSSQ